ncbi:MAG: right-handed parallel beta-helix repeat-containing protein [Candidatus Coatesbacteria bacterium]|nr:right-handed parallel beta-helix repeat-containing protein [Candidatus Coatesbacteria bacterium]
MRSYSVPFFAILTILAVFGPAFATDHYVDVNTGDDANSGLSPDAAWKSITHALEAGGGTQDDQYIIHVAPGTYTTPLESFRLEVRPYTSVVGAGPDQVVIDANGTDSVFNLWYDNTLSGLTITGGGDGVFAGGKGVLMNAYCRIDNCVVRGNLYRGVDIEYPGDGFAQLNDCIIHGNGGGVFMTSQYGEGLVKVTRCLISSNAATFGAAIYAVNTSLELVDSVIADNVADIRGAGLLFSACQGPLKSSDIQNCLFISNRTLDGLGGAASVDQTRFSGCTFVSNTATHGASGLYAAARAVEVTDCIFRDGGDEISEPKAGLVRVNNSCVEGGWQGSGKYNLDADPLFVSGPFCDYYLSQRAAGQGQDSPCVDAGSMTAAAAGMAAKTTRTDGMPDTGVVDIGFHYPTHFTLPEVWVSNPSDTYSHGDTLEMVFKAMNPNPFSYPVELYAAIIAADGVIWTIDSSWNWSASLNPWFASLELPAGFIFGPTTLLTIALPSASPPISDPGAYFAAAAFAHVGTTTFIGQPSLSAFHLVADQ